MIENQKVRRMVWRLISVAFTLFMFAVLISAVEFKRGAGTQSLKVVIEDGEYNSFLQATDIEKMLIRRYGEELYGMPIGQVKVNELEEMLEFDPFIRTAEAFYDAKNCLHIRIDQRKPIVRVIDRNNESYYLDTDGIRMPLSASYTARVPVASGNLGAYVENYLLEESYSLKELFEVSNYIHQDVFLRALIEQIYRDRKGQFILIPKIGNQEIVLGDSKNLEARFDKLKVFYEEALPREGWRKYKKINLQFNEQVVCTKF